MNRTPAPPKLLILAAIGLAFAPACSSSDDDAPPPIGGLASSRPVAEFDANVPVRWHELLYMRIKARGINPPRASRIFGYAGVALYETLAPGMPQHESLQGQLNGLPAGTLPAPVDAEHHWPSAANRALAVVAAALIDMSQTEFDALETAIDDEFAPFVSQEVRDRSAAFGESVANAVLAWAATDGFANQTACGMAFVPPPDHDTPAEGAWTQVSGANPPLLPCWGDLRTFVVPDSQSCSAVGPPPFSTSTSSAWYAQSLLVYNTTGDAGAGLTADERAIASFWSDGATQTGTPPGHWVALTCQVCSDDALTLDVAAEAFARVGMAVADAFITCWETKYVYYLQRPATYIRAQIDMGWDPYLGTPNFPTYASGHSTQSGAAATVMTDLFGPYAFTDSTHSRLNPELSSLPNGAEYADRSFTSFGSAAQEAAASRLYGGIHYLFDNYDGYDQGVCIGTIHNATLRFRSAP